MLPKEVQVLLDKFFHLVNETRLIEIKSKKYDTLMDSIEKTANDLLEVLNIYEFSPAKKILKAVAKEFKEACALYQAIDSKKTEKAFLKQMHLAYDRLLMETAALIGNEKDDEELMVLKDNSEENYEEIKALVKELSRASDDYAVTEDDDEELVMAVIWHTARELKGALEKYAGFKGKDALWTIADDFEQAFNLYCEANSDSENKNFNCLISFMEHMVKAKTALNEFLFSMKKHTQQSGKKEENPKLGDVLGALLEATHDYLKSDDFEKDDKIVGAIAGIILHLNKNLKDMPRCDAKDILVDIAGEYSQMVLMFNDAKMTMDTMPDASMEDFLEVLEQMKIAHASLLAFMEATTRAIAMKESEE